MLFPAPRLVVAVVGGGPLWNLLREVSHFSSVQSVQFSWFGEASQGDPKNSNSCEILKVKSVGPQTCPFPPF